MIREVVKDFLNNCSSEKVLVMPIAKSSFAATCFNKEWVNEVDYNDCVKALKNCDVIPSIIIGEKEYFNAKHPLGFDFVLKEENQEKRIYECIISTVIGDITLEQTFIKKQTGVLTKNILSDENGLNKLEAYLKAVYDNVKDIKENVLKIRKTVGEECIIQFFLPQPFEIYCLAGREEAIYLKYDENEDFENVKRAILKVVLKLIDEISDTKAVDFFLFGSAGSELYSPDMFDEEFFASSKAIITKARESGVPTIFHACGNMKAFVEKSRLLELKPDVFEGMAFEPIGDLSPHHIDKMDKDIILRGNIDLGLLRNGTKEQIKKAANGLAALFSDRKIFLSGSCDILYGTSEENVKALGEK